MSATDLPSFTLLFMHSLSFPSLQLGRARRTEKLAACHPLSGIVLSRLRLSRFLSFSFLDSPSHTKGGMTRTS